MRVRPLSHALGLAIATLAVPSMGCTDSHTGSEDQRSTPDTSALADAATTAPDVALAMDAPPPSDAGTDAPVLEDAGDLPDGYYPDGIRG